MLILIDQCLLNVVQHDRSIEWSKFPPSKIPLPPPFNPTWKNLVCLNACFSLFSNPFFISNFSRSTSLKLRLQNFNIGGGSEDL